MISSVVNFHMNKTMVFHSKVSTGKAMVRYYTLAVVQLAAQVALEGLAFFLFGISEEATTLRMVIHVIVMTLLYFASYVIQQRWVFAAEKSK